MGVSLIPRPHPQNGKGLVTFKCFLVVLCQQNARDYIQYCTSCAICMPCGCHMTADTAQPRKHSNVTRPFPILWVWSGDKTRWGLVYDLSHDCHVISLQDNLSLSLSVCVSRDGGVVG